MSTSEMFKLIRRDNKMHRIQILLLHHTTTLTTILLPMDSTRLTAVERI